MNDDLQGQIDAQFDVLNQTENEEEKMRRMAEEAAAANASAPVVEQQAAPAPQPEATAPESAPEAGGGPTEEAKGPGAMGPTEQISGVQKFLEENIGIPGADLVNNIGAALGLTEDKTPDEIAQERAAQRGQAAAELDEMRNAEGIAPEVTRTVSGALAGAAENTINTLEILGDVAKSIPGLVNQEWKPDAKDDIFQFGPDSKYSWAKWDLGKDEIGAKTAAGKVTQGFLEVATVMAASGGFAGAAKGAGVVKSGLVGARAGIIGDMVSAASGDGNLSTLIRENAPSWYPQWLTALAVQEDDNPLTAMVKTAAEGSVLGFAVDGMGAFLAGARAANRARAGKATDAEIAKAAETGFMKHQEAVERAGNAGQTAQEAIAHVRQRMTDVQRPSPVYHATTPEAAEAIRKGGFKGGSEGSNILGSGVYTANDLAYAKSYGSEVLEIDTQGLSIRDMDRPMQQFMDENGINYRYYDLSTGKDVDINNPGDLTFEDIGLDIDVASKKQLRELLSAGGEYQGVRYDPVFQTNERGAGTETLLFDPTQARIAAPRTETDFSRFTGYRRMLEEGGDYIAMTGDSILKENYMRLYEQAANGVPVSIDDVKLLFPEKFTPGTRVIQEPRIVGLDQAVESLPQTGGFTIDPTTGVAPVDGTMVAIDGVTLEKLDDDSIAAFMSQYYDLLTRDDVFIGGWISERTGKPVLELSRKVADGDEAMMFGKLFDQEGVFRNSDYEYIPTGGADELKLTEGMHVRSQTGRAPMNPAPTNKVDAAASAVAETGYGVPNTAQRVMTDAKFKMIAEGTDDYTQRILRGMLEDGSVPLNNISKVVGKSTEQLAKEAREFIQMVTGGSGTIDFSKIKGAARDQYGNEILGDAQLVAVIQMMKDTSQAISASVKGLTTKFEAGMDVADDLVRLANQQKALMKIHKETTAFQGRSLYNNRIDLADVDIDNPLPPVDVQKLQRQYDKATKKLDDMVEAAVSGDPAAKQEAYRMALQLNLAGGRPEDLVSIQKSIGSGVTEQLLGNMYNSLLSGPETHLVNSLSSLVMTVYRPLSLTIGSGFKRNAEAFAAFHGINQTLSDAWRLTSDAYKQARSGQVANRKTGQRLTSGLEQLRTHQAYAEASSNPFVKAAVGFESMLYDLRQNPLLAWSGPLMEAEDTFASAISARFEFNSNMMRRAIEEANGDNVDDVFRALLDQEKKRYFTESGEILDPRLQEVADESTFRHKLEGKAVEFADLVAKIPALRPFFPFVKTGHNIMVFTAESTPLTVFTKEWQDVMAGSDEAAKSILRGRAATGSFVMLSAALMAGQGLITGNGPAPGPARDAWERNHKPRSIKIGDQWVSYERMEPFSSVIQAAADVTWGIKEGLISEDKAQYLTSYMTYAFAANFTDKSVFSGLEPLSRILNPTGNSAEAVAMVPAEVINNVIPGASLRRALANAMQPHRDYYDSQWQRLLDQATGGILPGVGHTQYDWLDGSPITSGNQGLYNAISPLNVHKRGTDIVRDTLETLGYDSQTILKTTSGEELTAQERSELSKLMGGGALFKELESAIKVRGYDKFGEELRKARGRDLDVTGVFEKGGNLGTDAQQSAYVEINEIVMKHRDMALEAIRTRNSRLDTAAGKKQQRKDEARTRTAEDLRNFHKN